MLEKEWTALLLYAIFNNYYKVLAKEKPLKVSKEYSNLYKACWNV